MDGRLEALVTARGINHSTKIMASLIMRRRIPWVTIHHMGILKRRVDILVPSSKARCSMVASNSSMRHSSRWGIKNQRARRRASVVGFVWLCEQDAWWLCGGVATTLIPRFGHSLPYSRTNWKERFVDTDAASNLPAAPRSFFSFHGYLKTS